MKSLFLSNFILKIIAIVTMTLDHIGFFLMQYSPYDNSPMQITGYIFRIIGRISLPLFCFLAVEGALKTKNIKNYLLRLTIVMLFLIVVEFVLEMLFIGGIISDNQRLLQPNIFITLFLGVLMVWLFENKNKYIKFLGILPIVYCILGFVVNVYEYQNQNTTIYWLPYFLRPEYDILAIMLFLVFYSSYKLLPVLMESYGLKPNLYENDLKYRLYLNLLSFCGLIIVSLIYYSFTIFANEIVYWDANEQLIMMCAAIFIIFYNGKRGYDRRWFRIFTYSYYPLHLFLIFIIFTLIYL